MSKQKVKDAFAVALLIFFLIVMIVGLHSLDRMPTSNIAAVAAVIGIIGAIVSLFVAVPLILSDGESEEE